LPLFEKFIATSEGEGRTAVVGGQVKEGDEEGGGERGGCGLGFETEKKGERFEKK